MYRRRFLQLAGCAVALHLDIALAAASARAQAQTGGNFQTVLEQINALRTAPANAQATMDKLIAAAFPVAAEREALLRENAGDGKTHGQNLTAFVAFLKNKTTMASLTWDADLAVISASGGISRNSFLKPEHSFGAFDTDPARALLWPILKGTTFEYQPLFDPGLRFGGAALSDQKLFLTVSSLKGAAFTRSNEVIGKNAYDPRLDDAPPWVFALFLKEPNIIPYTKSDGTLDVAWRAMGSKEVSITRFSASGAKVWTKRVPGVAAGEYSLLMGFTEDKDGSMYIARCKDEAAPREDIDTPKENPNNTYDRTDLVKLTKMTKDGGEVWTRDFAKKGGDAGAYFSPLSASGKGIYGASSRIACTTIKQAVYRLAEKPEILVPPQIAEQSLLGYTVNRAGVRSPNRFESRCQPAEAGGVLTPKVKLQFEEDIAGGKVLAATGRPDKPAVFFEDGGVQEFSTISFSPDEYSNFIAFVQTNKQGEGKEQFVAPEKLKLKVSLEETPLVFLIYGSATSWDANINGRHQQAYWRAVDARTGEPCPNLNSRAMAHSFDARILVTDEGIITAERSDAFLLMSNYLQTRPGPVFLAAFNTVSDGNEAFAQLGGLAEAEDGYLLLYAANNNKGEATFNRDDGLTDAQAEEASLMQRDIGVLRAKKGFAQQIDAVRDTNEDEFNKMLDSRKARKTSVTSQFLLLPKYITTYYRDKQPYSAGRAKIVRVADGNFVVLWERWTDTVTTNTDGKKERSGVFDSTWAMKIDKNGATLLPPVKISDTLRLLRGDDPVAWNGKAAFVSGDAVTDTFVIHTIDSNLKYTSTATPL
jgi:hypothetical protein